MRGASFLGLMGVLVGLSAALPANAEAVPECGNVRFEGLSNCEVRVNAECDAGCSKLGIYDVRCATKLVTVCDQTCTLTGTTGCSDMCNTQCKSDCDNGVNVICAMNCFGECTVDRDAQCAIATNQAQCKATWDANCDSKCDAKCVTVDGGCYQHCIECCDGSCTAEANMDCQQTCQQKEFQTCDKEFQAECSASCTGDGSLFCNDTFIVSASQIPACINALAAKGVQVKAEANVSIGPDGINGDISAGLCSYSPQTKTSLAAPFAALAAAAGWLARRRRNARKSS